MHYNHYTKKRKKKLSTTKRFQKVKD